VCLLRGAVFLTVIQINFSLSRVIVLLFVFIGMNIWVI